MCRTNSTHQSVFPLVAEICMYKKCSAVSRLMSEVMSLESALVESEDNKLKNRKKKKISASASLILLLFLIHH